MEKEVLSDLTSKPMLDFTLLFMESNHEVEYDDGPRTVSESGISLLEYP